MNKKSSNLLSIMLVPILLISSLIFIVSFIFSNSPGVIKIPENYIPSSGVSEKMSRSFSSIDDSNDDNLIFENKYYNNQYFVDQLAKDLISDDEFMYPKNDDITFDTFYKMVDENNALLKILLKNENFDTLNEYYFSIKNKFIL